MCLVNISFKQHPKYKLIIAANRDEFYARPTKEAHYWPDHPELFAGRDLRGNGTWLGMTTTGKFAALTNYRHPDYMYGDKKTRGKILTDFLRDGPSPEQYAQRLSHTAEQFNGYNILFGDIDHLYYFNNVDQRYEQLQQGFYSLSNAFLNTPWPKVRRARTNLQHYIDKHDVLQAEALFSILHDETIAPEVELPNTGVGLPLEKQLSPLFIRTNDYGTRCSTIILVSYDGVVDIYERTYENGVFLKDVSTSFNL